MMTLLGARALDAHHTRTALLHSVRKQALRSFSTCDETFIFFNLTIICITNKKLENHVKTGAFNDQKLRNVSLRSTVLSLYLPLICLRVLCNLPPKQPHPLLFHHLQAVSIFHFLLLMMAFRHCIAQGSEDL